MEDIAGIATAAGTFVAGYLAQGAKQLGDKVRDGAVDRLYKLIEPRLLGTASGTTALQSLREQPDAPPRQNMVSAVLADLAHADPGFAAQLGQAVRDIYNSQSAPDATAGGAQVIIQQDGRNRLRTGDFALRDIDKSKHTIRIGTGGIFIGVILLVAILGTTAGISYNIGDSDKGNTGSAQTPQLPGVPGTSSRPSDDAANGGGSYRDNHVFTTLPYEAVRMFYQKVAQNDPDDACGRMWEQAAMEFARSEGFPNCHAAIAGFAQKVTNRNAYAESIPSSVSQPLPPDTIKIDSCDYSIRGGPALGIFTVTKVYMGQWLITGHKSGPAMCLG